jgi:hypothetical protein
MLPNACPAIEPLEPRWAPARLLGGPLPPQFGAQLSTALPEGVDADALGVGIGSVLSLVKFGAPLHLALPLSDLASTSLHLLHTIPFPDGLIGVELVTNSPADNAGDESGSGINVSLSGSLTLSGGTIYGGSLNLGTYGGSITLVSGATLSLVNSGTLTLAAPAFNVADNVGVISGYRLSNLTLAGLGSRLIAAGYEGTLLTRLPASTLTDAEPQSEPETPPEDVSDFIGITPNPL